MIASAVVAVATELRQLGPALANHLWQSTVFAAVAGLLTLALRQNQARARYSLWMAASLKFMVPFALLVAAGSHFARPRPTVPAPEDGMYFAMQEAGQRLAAQVSPVMSPVVAPERTEISDLLPVAGGVVWVVGFVAVLLCWAVRWRRVAAALRNAEPVCEGRVWETLRRIEHA